jgi:hypothetical protein
MNQCSAEVKGAFHCYNDKESRVPNSDLCLKFRASKYSFLLETLLLRATETGTTMTCANVTFFKECFNFFSQGRTCNKK